MPRATKLPFSLTLSQALAGLAVIGLIALLLQGVLGISAGREQDPDLTVAGYEIETGDQVSDDEVVAGADADATATEEVGAGEAVTTTTSAGTQVSIRNQGTQNVQVQVRVFEDTGTVQVIVQNTGETDVPATVIELNLTDAQTGAEVSGANFDLTIELGQLATAEFRVAQEVGANQTAVVAIWTGTRWRDLPTAYNRDANSVSANVSQKGIYAVFVRDLTTAAATSQISAFVFRGPTGTDPAVAFAGSGASFFVFAAETQSYDRFIAGVPGNTLGSLAQFDPVFVSGGDASDLTLIAGPFRSRAVLLSPGIDIVTFTGTSKAIGSVTPQITGGWTIAWVWTNSAGWQRFMRDPALGFLNQITTLQQGSIVAIRSEQGLTWAME